jgi:hypothetical protein
MRFGRKHTDPLRDRKSHMRLFGQVMLLGFMLIAVQWAAQGRNWTWLVPEKAPTSAQTELKPLDFKVKPHSAPPLAPGEVRVTTETTPGTPAITSVESRLPAESLASMDDGRLGMLRAEQIAVDQIVAQVRGLDVPTMLRSAGRDVGFVELNDRPAEYRGRLLAFRGTLWRLTPQGDDLFEAWVYTSDAANNPTRVLLTELPAAITPGNKLDQPIEFAGYFIKRYGYATERGTHVAPLFVARTLTLKPAIGASQKLRRQQSWLQWILGLAVACFATLFLFRQLSRELQPPKKRELPGKLPISVDPDPASDNPLG